MSQETGHNNHDRNGHETHRPSGIGSDNPHQPNVSGGDEPSTPVGPNASGSTRVEPGSPRSEASRPSTRGEGTAQTGTDTLKAIGGHVSEDDVNVRNPPQHIEEDESATNENKHDEDDNEGERGDENNGDENNGDENNGDENNGDEDGKETSTIK